MLQDAILLTTEHKISKFIIFTLSEFSITEYLYSVTLSFFLELLGVEELGLLSVHCSVCELGSTTE